MCLDKCGYMWIHATPSHVTNMGFGVDRWSGYSYPSKDAKRYVYTLALVFFLTFVPSPSQAQFHWYTSTWGDCYQPTCERAGYMTRNVTCHLNSGQKVMEDNCLSELKPRNWKECSKFPCAERAMFEMAEVYPGETSLEDGYPSSYDPVRDSQDQGYTEGWSRGNQGAGGSFLNVEWVVSAFGSCRLRPGLTSCGVKSGIQYRNVTCQLKNSHQFANEARCLQGEPKPLTAQACELQCRQDCVVSNFSVANTCESMACQMPNRTWTRRVIVPPRHLGSYCPDLSYMKPCPKCSTAYTYKIGDWSPCTKMRVGKYARFQPDHYLIGYQTRDVTCLQSKGVIASIESCTGALPRTSVLSSRSCVMPRDCQVSEWSEFSHLNDSCRKPDGTLQYGFKIRTRQVLQFPLGDGRPCPPNLIDHLQQSNRELRDLKYCRSAKWIQSDWSPCRAVPGHNNCATGMQTRTAICVEMDDESDTERPVDDGRCIRSRPLEAKSCEVECNRDCTVSQWSAWSTCQTDDCVGANLRKRQTSMGQSYRTRTVLTMPGSSGQSCPHLSESRMCHPEPCFRWHLTKNQCQANTGNCGAGSYEQRASCINREGTVERPFHCNIQLEPVKSWVSCYVPCPWDCVVSEWGEWSQCPDPCANQGSGPGLRVRQRVILGQNGSPRGENVMKCPHPDALREVENCPVMYDCAIYRWEVGPWEKCTVDLSKPESDLTSLGGIDPYGRRRGNCGVGLQVRSVKCMSSKGDLADPGKCVEKIKPSSTHPCNVTCPIDCHISEWSEWSACSATCTPYAVLNYPTRYRKRYVLQDAENGGGPCPSELHEQMTCLELPRCQKYSWEMSDWSECILPLTMPRCGQGLRARNITCKQIDSTGEKEMAISDCVERMGNMAEMTQECTVPCDSHCQLSQWSDWTSCSPGRCNKNRFRSRHLEGQSRENPRCRDTDLYPRDQHEECPCSTHQNQMDGEWSDCILAEKIETGTRFAQMSLSSIQQRLNLSSSVGTGTQTECGKGKRFMALRCLNPQQDALGNTRCLGEQYRDENCSIPCPVDCQMSEWTEWTQCSVQCGSGIMYRSRKVVTQQANGGRLCPSMAGKTKDTQSKVCSVSCTYYKWRVEDWGVCRPHSSRTCGSGSHSRTIRCISMGTDGSQLPVGERFCDAGKRPLAIKECYMPCPMECVLSEWSEWTRCDAPSITQMQTRSRTLLRPGASHAQSRGCADERDERACPDSSRGYAWELSGWTSCLVNDGESECGPGHKEKFVICRNGLGEKVDPHYCEEEAAPVTEPLVVSCEVPCDNDCLMTPWTMWTQCTTSCGLGTTRRRRSILKHHVGLGRQCPLKLEQSKPCFNKGCYIWFVSDWSSCGAQVGICGVGVQERNVSCLDEQGRGVNSSKCSLDPAKLVMPTKRSCRIPCPGECKLSEWTDWTKCHVSCQDFRHGITAGVRARSRAILAHPSLGNPPCDTELWQQEPCEATECAYFEWHASRWNVMTKHRRVVCMRNDGLEVTGPCDESIRPLETLSCENPACVKPAICRDTDTCACIEEPGTVHVIQSINSTAETCVMNGTTLTDSTDATKVGKSPNIWMYAVIAIGTLFVIAVTAALYNMCELFRTGPRPRRKGQASTTASSANSLHTLHHQQQQQQLRRQQQVDGKSIGGVGSLDEINESTTLVDCTGPNCLENGTIAQGENLYKQINNGRGRGGVLGDEEGVKVIREGGRYGNEDDRASNPLLQQRGGIATGEDYEDDLNAVPRDTVLPLASSSHHRYPQPCPEPAIYNNFPRNSSGAHSSSSSQPKRTDFDTEGIPDFNDSSSPTASSTSPATMVTPINTTNSTTSPSTPGYSNISTGKTPATVSSSNISNAAGGGFNNGGKNIYANSRNFNRVNGPSEVSTLSRDERGSNRMLLNSQHLLPNQPHGDPATNSLKQKQQQQQQQQQHEMHQKQEPRRNLSNNRRYKRIHRLLPTRMIECLVREPEGGVDSDDNEGERDRRVRNGSPNRMAAPSHTNYRGSAYGSQDFHDGDPNTGMSLTLSSRCDRNYIEDIRQTNYDAFFRPSPSPSSSYGNNLMLQEHVCMLTPPPPPAPVSPSSPHELRPANLRLDSRQSRDRLSASPEPKHERLDTFRPSPSGSNGPVSGPRAAGGSVNLPPQNNSLWPGDHQSRVRQLHGATKIPGVHKQNYGGTPSCASSDSMPLSTLTDQMVLGFQQMDNSIGAESCSQCSLQLGDTAETLRIDDTRLPSDRAKSVDRESEGSLPTVPEKEDFSKGFPNSLLNPEYTDIIEDLEGSQTSFIPSFPPPPPPPPPLETNEGDPQAPSSFSLSSCSPDLQNLLRPALNNSNLGSTFIQDDSRLNKKPISNQQDQNFRSDRYLDGIYNSPLHVDIANSDTRATLPYMSTQDRPKVPYNLMNPSSVDTPHNTYSNDQFVGGNLTPNRAMKTNNGLPASTSTSPRGLESGQTRTLRDSDQQDTPTPYPVKSSASLPEAIRTSGLRREDARSGSRSPRQLPFLPARRSPASENTRGTSEDSGRSTLPHSPSASPRGGQSKARPNALYDLCSHGFPEVVQGGQRPSRGMLRAQESTESEQDSVSPSMCDECQIEQGQQLRADIYALPSSATPPLTPGSRSQISNMSGVETSV